LIWLLVLDRVESIAQAPDPTAHVAARRQRQYLDRMLNDIRRVFRQSIEAFRNELSSDDPEDQVAALLSAMRRELVATRAALPELSDDIVRVKAELDRERDLLTQCERRAQMAERIGDAETVRVAKEFAERHAGKVDVLEQKLTAAQAELEFRRKEADEMTVRYKEADANRFALLAQLRTAGARRRMRDVTDTDNGSFADFDRMRQKVEQDASYIDAGIELDEEIGGGGPARPAAPDVEERLRELKRRMGRDN
jgi:phage shock protein A